MPLSILSPRLHLSVLQDLRVGSCRQHPLRYGGKTGPWQSQPRIGIFPYIHQRVELWSETLYIACHMVLARESFTHYSGLELPDPYARTLSTTDLVNGEPQIAFWYMREREIKLSQPTSITLILPITKKIWAWHAAHCLVSGAGRENVFVISEGHWAPGSLDQSCEPHRTFGKRPIWTQKGRY